jgi:DNA-binding CsgD family transcriptional regulator
LSEKTVERQFLYELERDFELAPATSRAVLFAARQVLFPLRGNGEVREGQIRVTAVSVEEPSGKPLSAMRKVGVVVTVDSGLEDLEVLKRFGWRRLRRVRLLRMAEEAVDQGGVLTQEDLSRVLQVGVRTIRRDIRALRSAGHWVPTRGTVKEIGRGQSHKAKIVEMYLQGMTYSQIVRRARHSPSSIKRYVESFGRVLVLWEHGVKEAREIGYILGVSERLAGEYLTLRKRYNRQEYRDRLEEIARQVRRVLGGFGGLKRGA